MSWSVFGVPVTACLPRSGRAPDVEFVIDVEVDGLVFGASESSDSGREIDADHEAEDNEQSDGKPVSDEDLAGCSDARIARIIA